jgi:hypothetical protein
VPHASTGMPYGEAASTAAGAWRGEYLPLDQSRTVSGERLHASATASSPCDSTHARRSLAPSFCGVAFRFALVPTIGLTIRYAIRAALRAMLVSQLVLMFGVRFHP